jgi:hypothetical protein
LLLTAFSTVSSYTFAESCLNVVAEATVEAVAPVETHSVDRAAVVAMEIAADVDVETESGADVDEEAKIGVGVREEAEIVVAAAVPGLVRLKAASLPRCRIALRQVPQEASTCKTCRRYILPSADI